MSQENVEIVRRAVEAFNEAGMGSEATLSFFDVAGVFEEPPEQPGPRVVHGRESVSRMFTQFDAAWEEHQSHPDEVRAIDDDRVLLLSRDHFRGRDGIEIDQTSGTIFTLRGGKIVRMQAFWDRMNALEAAGLSEQAMSEENVKLTRRSWEAWQRGDIDAMFELWDRDIVWDLTHFRDWPESTYKGHEGVRHFLSEWLEVWDDYEMGVDETLATRDGRVISLAWQRGKGRQSGLEMHSEWAQIATFRDGKITRLDNYDDRDGALEAAGLSE